MTSIGKPRISVVQKVTAQTTGRMPVARNSAQPMPISSAKASETIVRSAVIRAPRARLGSQSPKRSAS